MTVKYSSNVATISFPGFFKTVFSWEGSIWKSVYAELSIWCFLFILFTLIYRLALNDGQQEIFERFCLYCYKNSSLIPFEFLLGYYITLVVSRWTRYWNSVGFLDSICLAANTYIRHGDLVRAQMYRRNIVRLVCLYQIMVYRVLIKGVRKRYPDMKSLAEAGYIHEDELDQFAETKFWMPIKWAMYLVRQARHEGIVLDDFGCSQLYDYITTFRKTIIQLWLDDWVPIPLAFTQVAFASLRVYFIVLLFGRQFLNTDRTTVRSAIDIYVPILTLIQFVLYVGWCKICETLVNPLGYDDDDIDYNFVMSRNLNVGMDIVTGIEARQPKLLDDDTKPELPKIIINSEDAADKNGFGSIANLNTRGRRLSNVPIIMVKRSEVNVLKPTELRRFRSNSTVISSNSDYLSPYDAPRVLRPSLPNLEAGLTWQAALKNAPVMKKDGLVNPKTYCSQHSCPSQLTEEKTTQPLGTLAEADEEHGPADDWYNELPQIAIEDADNIKNCTIENQNHLMKPSQRNGTFKNIHQVHSDSCLIKHSSIADGNFANNKTGDLPKPEKQKPDNTAFVEITDEIIPEERESDLSTASDSFDSNSDNILIIPVGTHKRKVY